MAGRGGVRRSAGCNPRTFPHPVDRLGSAALPELVLKSVTLRKHFEDAWRNMPLDSGTCRRDYHGAPSTGSRTHAPSRVFLATWSDEHCRRAAGGEDSAPWLYLAG